MYTLTAVKFPGWLVVGAIKAHQRDGLTVLSTERQLSVLDSSDQSRVVFKRERLELLRNRHQVVPWMTRPPQVFTARFYYFCMQYTCSNNVTVACFDRAARTAIVEMCSPILVMYSWGVRLNVGRSLVRASLPLPDVQIWVWKHITVKLLCTIRI